MSYNYIRPLFYIYRVLSFSYLFQIVPVKSVLVKHVFFQLQLH